nr:hypothetical protein BaRGS_006792 [Batillaria attramentaria]
MCVRAHDHGMKNADVTVGMAILSCCFLVGITGNSLVIWIYTYVIKEGNIRLIAIAMAVFDLTMSVIVVPGNIILLVLDHRNLLTDSRACKFLLGMQMYLLGASQWMVAVLCYERLFKLWRPCHLVLQEKARAKRHILTAVVFAALLAAPQVLMSGLTVKSLPEGEVLQVSSNDALQMRLAREESFRRLEEKLFQGYSDLSLRYMAKLPTSPLPQANGRRRDSLESELQSLASSAFICVLGRLVMFVAISLLPYAIMMFAVTYVAGKSKTA